MAEPVTATERLFLTTDKERVVPEGDPNAAFLFANEGEEISDEDAERYGLDKKSAPKPADKQAQVSANKAASTPAAKSTRRK